MKNFLLTSIKGCLGRGLLLIPLLLLCSRGLAQKTNINIPLDGGPDALWMKIPILTGSEEDDDVTYNINGTRGNKDFSCANRAMKMLKGYLSRYRAQVGLKKGVEVGSSVISMLPAAEGAKTVADIVKTAFAASQVESQSDLNDLIQQELVKRLGDKLGSKIDDPEFKQAFKDAMDSLMSNAFRKIESSNIDASFSDDCKGHLSIHFVKTGENHFKMAFRATGDCKCNNKADPLGAWDVSGEMDATVTDMTHRDKYLQKYRDDDYDLTLTWGKPTFHVTAECNCNLQTSYNTGGGSGPTYSNAQNVSNQAYAGLSLISEDSDPRFNTYGGEVAFTHYLNDAVGITGDAGLNFGSQNMVDYRKLTIMAGLTIIPLQQMAVAAKVNLYAHLLIGLSAINASVGTYSANSTAFAGELGAGINIPIKKGWYVKALEINDQFAAPKGGLKTNIKFTAGIVADLPFMK